MAYARRSESEGKGSEKGDEDVDREHFACSKVSIVTMQRLNMN